MAANILTVPSGVEYTDLDVRLLLRMREVGFVQYSDKPFTFKSGIRSNVYVYGREDLTENPDLLWMVGQKMCLVLTEQLRVPSHQQVCLIGIPTAGTPFAQAASMVSLREDFNINRYTDDCGGQHHPMPICFQIMKEKPKDYGAHKGWINGKADDQWKHYVLVDNVATNGDTKIEATEKLKQDGYFGGPDSNDRPSVFIWVDRQQGAVNNLHAAGFRQVLIGYNLLDLTYAYGELGLWPKSAVEAVEKEIREHQLLSTTAST
jgi:orotate phosphoribosyltransferase